MHDNAGLNVLVALPYYDRVVSLICTPNELSSESIACVDLFAGAGGLTLGLQWAGFKAMVLNDNWDPAISTLNRNFEGVVVSRDDVRGLTGMDILELSGNVRPSLVVGGAPCQGFTSAGARRAFDKRNTLVREFSRLVVELSPKWFLFENVEGFLTMSGGDFVTDLLDDLIECGYQVRLRKVNIANYGVPQLRKRVVVIGALHTDPGFPSPSHHAYGAPGAQLKRTESLPLAPCVHDALVGLPPVAASVAEAKVQGHFVTPSTGDELQRIESLQCGQTMGDLPPSLQHPSYSRRANRRVADGMPTHRRGGAPYGLRRLRPDEPSKAITSGAGREFVHPRLNRFLSLRECARLQGFPDDFEFVGNRTEQATLIGNSVPPVFGEIIGHWIGSRMDTNNDHSVPGRLLEFYVTNGSAMSPSLRNVVSRISDRYNLGEMSLWS